MVVKELGHTLLADVRVVTLLQTSNELLQVEIVKRITLLPHVIKVQGNERGCENIVIDGLFEPANSFQEVLDHTPLVPEPKAGKTIDNLSDTELRLSCDLIIALDDFQEVQILVVSRISQEYKLGFDCAQVSNRLFKLMPVRDFLLNL